MKKFPSPPIFILILFLSFTGVPDAQSQLIKKLKKKAENVTTRKLEDKTEKGTEKVIDAIFGKENKDENNQSGETSHSIHKNPEVNADGPALNNKMEEVAMYSKSDWVAGENLILYEDFSKDPLGDFPQLWNTDASGEVVSISSHPEVKWLKLYNRGTYQPDLPKNLPADFTLDFDVIGYNVNENNTSQTAMLHVILGDGKIPLKQGNIYASASISPYPNWVKPQKFKSWESKNGEIIAGVREKDIRKAMVEGAHIAVSVMGSRYRLYVNGDKIFDFPRAIPDGALLNSLLFNIYGLDDNTQNMLISNLRIAEGLPEPRDKLFNTGKYITNAILFDINSAELKPESFGILREISEAIKSEPNKKIVIVGHTDSDGADDFNLELSKKRSASVRNAMVDQFGIAADILSIEGKGESEPVAENSTPSEKAKNRRTEFIVQ